MLSGRFPLVSTHPLFVYLLYPALGRGGLLESILAVKGQQKKVILNLFRCNPIHTLPVDLEQIIGRFLAAA